MHVQGFQKNRPLLDKSFYIKVDISSYLTYSSLMRSLGIFLNHASFLGNPCIKSILSNACEVTGGGRRSSSGGARSPVPLSSASEPSMCPVPWIKNAFLLNVSGIMICHLV